MIAAQSLVLTYANITTKFNSIRSLYETGKTRAAEGEGTWRVKVGEYFEIHPSKNHKTSDAAIKGTTHIRDAVYAKPFVNR